MGNSQSDGRISLSRLDGLNLRDVVTIADNADQLRTITFGPNMT